jgi:hypothetical protein
MNCPVLSGVPEPFVARPNDSSLLRVLRDPSYRKDDIIEEMIKSI